MMMPEEREKDRAKQREDPVAVLIALARSSREHREETPRQSVRGTQFILAEQLTRSLPVHHVTVLPFCSCRLLSPMRIRLPHCTFLQPSKRPLYSSPDLESTVRPVQCRWLPVADTP